MLGQIVNGQMDFIQIIMYALSSLFIIFFILPIHEGAHAYTAVKLGDPTPKYQGRLTLNPFAHIDYIGALMILVFGFGWAKPVGINPRNFKNPKGGMAITALAGPLSNLLVAFVGLLLNNVVRVFLYAILPQTVFFMINYFFLFFIQINISLAVFNLIPIPPLDGSRILTAVLPDRIYYKLMQYERYIMMAFIVLVFMGAFNFISGLAALVYQGMSSVAALPFMPFLN